MKNVFADNLAHRPKPKPKEKTELDFRKPKSPPDLTRLAVVIPAGSLPTSPRRAERALRVVGAFVEAGFDPTQIFIAYQDGTDHAPPVADFEALGVTVVTTPPPAEYHYHKAAQVNNAVAAVPTGFDFIWVNDCDIWPSFNGVFRFIKRVGWDGWDWLRPWRTAFLKLNETQTQNFLKLRPGKRVMTVSARTTAKDSSHGHGAFIIRRTTWDAVSGFDEAYTGWGFEDDDIFARVRDTGAEIRTAPANWGVHLFHEQDRPRNPANARRFRDTHAEGNGWESRRSARVKQERNMVSPFATVGPGRVGSHLMGDSLRNHSLIWTRPGEPFGRPVSKGALTEPLAGEDLREFLFLKTFRREEPVCGLKINYDQPEANPNMEFLRSYMVQRMLDYDFKFIHLYRRNLADLVLSAWLARKQGRYHSQPYDPTNEPLPLDFVDTHLEYVMKGFGYYRRRLPAGRVLEVAFEDMVDDWDATMAKVQEFLGVPVETIAQAKVRQKTLENKDYITNYAAVRKRIREIMPYPDWRV